MQPSQALLYARLRPFTWRLRLRDTLQMFQRTAYVPGAGFVLMQIAGRAQPIPHLLWWSLLPAAGWAIALVGYLLGRRISALAAARRVDHLLGLRERLSTALELSAHAPEDEVAALQQADAIAMAGRIQARELGLAFRRDTLLRLFLPLLAGVALVLLPNPQDRVLHEQAAVAQAVANTIAAIDAQRADLGKNQELSPADRERLRRELDQLEKDLRASPRSREEALAKLSAAEARLRQQLDPQVDARRAGLDDLARQLRAQRQDPAAGHAGARDAPRELQQTKDQLAKLTSQQREQLAKTLKDQAAQNSNSDPQLSRSLQPCRTSSLHPTRPASSRSRVCRRAARA